jgi:hypothetical protein
MGMSIAIIRLLTCISIKTEQVGKEKHTGHLSSNKKEKKRR